MEFQEPIARERLTAMIIREPHRLSTRIRRLIYDNLTAEDLAQESLVRALRRLDTLRGTADEALLCKWLDRIACNVAFNHVRNQHRRPAMISLDAAVDPLAERLHAREPDPAAMVSQTETQDELWELIHALPSDIRAVFILRDIRELSTAETAGILGIKEGLVKWRLSRARQHLREQLSDIAP